MTKLVCLDLDNTLARINKPIYEDTIELLKVLSFRKIKIVITSRKPTVYLAGFVRQLNFDDLILVGENGMDIYYGKQIPPKGYFINKISEQESLWLKKIESDIKLMDAKIFLQANMVSITVFHRDETSKRKIREYAEAIKKQQNHINAYIHCDSVDFSPKRITKGNAILEIMDTLNVNKNDVYSIGDGESDISMFKESGTSITLTKSLSRFANKYKPTINEALLYIINNLED